MNVNFLWSVSCYCPSCAWINGSTSDIFFAGQCQICCIFFLVWISFCSFWWILMDPPMILSEISNAVHQVRLSFFFFLLSAKIYSLRLFVLLLVPLSRNPKRYWLRFYREPIKSWQRILFVCKYPIPTDVLAPVSLGPSLHATTAIEHAGKQN